MKSRVLSQVLQVMFFLSCLLQLMHLNLPLQKRLNFNQEVIYQKNISSTCKGVIYKTIRDGILRTILFWCKCSTFLQGFPPPYCCVVVFVIIIIIIITRDQGKQQLNTYLTVSY